MPTIERIGPYRFFFYSNERGEPPHVHVQRERKLCKYWLDPVTLASAGRYNRRELKQIERIVELNRSRFLEAWRGFLEDRG